jgi:hypothetical protein
MIQLTPPCFLPVCCCTPKCLYNIIDDELSVKLVSLRVDLLHIRDNLGSCLIILVCEPRAVLFALGGIVLPVHLELFFFGLFIEGPQCCQTGLWVLLKIRMPLESLCWWNLQAENQVPIRVLVLKSFIFEFRGVSRTFSELKTCKSSRSKGKREK